MFYTNITHRKIIGIFKNVFLISIVLVMMISLKMSGLSNKLGELSKILMHILFYEIKCLIIMFI